MCGIFHRLGIRRSHALYAGLSVAGRISRDPSIEQYGFTNKYRGTWSGGITGVAAFNDPTGTAYIWSYRRDDGASWIYQVNPTGTGLTQTWSGNFTGGFNTFAGCMSGLNSYVLAYRGAQNAPCTLCILQIKRNGAGFDTVFTSPREPAARD